MPQSPLVSVIMPILNTERYVAEAVESILGQTYGNFEFLIADGGSTDRSRAIVEGYAANDSRLRMWIRPDTNPQERLNELLDQSEGEFVALMHADDVSLPERLERQVAFLQANPDYAVVGSQTLVIDPDGDPLCTWCKEQTHEEIEALQFCGTHGSVIPHGASMYRRECVLAVGKYRTDLYFADDLELFFRLAEHGWRMANLPCVLLKYRLHPNSVCNREPLAMWEKTQEIIQETRARRGLAQVPVVKPADLDDALDLFSQRLKWGWWALGDGYISSARKYARYCVKHAPFSPQTWRLVYCSIRGH